MNKKSKLKKRAIGVSLIALSLGALTFGVYAAKNAKLTANGSVGFIAHDAQVKISATIKGDAVVTDAESVDGLRADQHGTPYMLGRNYFNTESDKVDENGVVELGTTADNINIALSEAANDIDKIYFSDLTPAGKTAPITIEFKVENLSVYPVTVTLSNTLDAAAAEKGVRVSDLSDTIQLEQTNPEDDSDLGTVSITFNLDEVNGDYQDIDSLTYGLKLEVRKGTLENGGTDDPEGGDDVVEAIQLANPANGAIAGADVSWTAVENATKYKLEYVYGGNVEKSVMIDSNSYSMVEDLVDLSMGNDYKVVLYALGDGTNYTDSTGIEIGTVKGKKDTTIATPVGSYDSTTNILSWEPANNATRYKITVSVPELSYYESFYTEELSYDLTSVLENITSSLTANISLQALNQSGSMSAESYQTTDIGSGSALARLTAPNVTLEEGVLTWDSVDDARGYVLQYTNHTRGDAIGTRNIAADTLTIDLNTVLNSLPFKNEFTFKLYAVGDNTTCLNSDMVDIDGEYLGKNDGVLTDLGFLNVTQWAENGEMVAKWETVPNATGYNIIITNISDSNNTSEETIEPTIEEGIASYDVSEILARYSTTQNISIAVYATGDYITYKDSMSNTIYTGFGTKED